MREHSHRIVAAVAVVIGIAILWLGWRYITSPSIDDLVELALHGPSLAVQTTAAIQLVEYGDDAIPGLRRVALESVQPAVKSVCVEGLAKLWDYGSMDLFLDLAENGSPRVRGRAAQVVMRMTGRHRRYLSSAPEPDRRLLVQHMRDDWKEIQNAPAENQDELKRRLRESHEKER